MTEPRNAGKLLQEKFSYLKEFDLATPFPGFFLPGDNLVEVARYLKEELSFDLLADLSCIDASELERTPRFEVLYNFYSLKERDRLFLKVGVDEAEKKCRVPSLCPLYATANWYEREVWDMFGVRFDGHPYLKRILMYEGFEGHPLRKDYDICHRQPLIPGAD